MNTSCERGYLAICFSSSNSAMDALALVVVKCRKYIKYPKFKIHSFYFRANLNYIKIY